MDWEGEVEEDMMEASPIWYGRHDNVVMSWQQLSVLVKAGQCAWTVQEKERSF